ncbi:exported hypothetical protein [Paraburkholderia piptadeniae]|uniref:Uncharacterized protein n=1 Tax=Paraburkholderia piptadeniae TaxID=1701573 RepID=A0A1N7ST07_9BURK|nr:exported hypothetical protein [Paraburkholderia piptadeniae]
MRAGRIGSIAALSLGAALAQIQSDSWAVRRDEYVTAYRGVNEVRARRAAQWQRETGQVKRKGRQ